ncbi:MAG TPA: hypothetical protein VGE74_00865 [Gemmata sp.]
MTPRKKWLVRASGVLAAVVAVGGVWAAFNASVLRAKYAGQKLAGATTDEERARWADELVTYGTPGFEQLIRALTAGDAPTRAAAGAALDRHLTALPDGDPRAVTISGSVLDAFPAASPEGKGAILRLVPTVLNRTGSTHSDRCRAIVAEGLKMPDAEAQLAAVRLALHPEIRLRAEVVPLLTAPEPALRGASLFAVAAPNDGEQLLADDELFKWLHDPDAGVRKVCHDALITRDRSDVEIVLGRRLTHAEPSERLKLLLDLRYDHDVADPEPWLERLSRDPDPAVRAGAVRVMVELSQGGNQPLPMWVGRVADTDLHPTVRLVAGYYRARPIGAPAGVVPAGGP